MTILGLDHVQVAIPSGSEDQARTFYVGALGMREVPKPAALAVRGGLWLECGAQQLHLGVEKDFRPARKAHPALIVVGFDELISRLESQGYEVSSGEPLRGLRRAFVYDPFGNRIELLEHVAKED